MHHKQWGRGVWSVVVYGWVGVIDSLKVGLHHVGAFVWAVKKVLSEYIVPLQCPEHLAQSYNRCYSHTVNRWRYWKFSIIHLKIIFGGVRPTNEDWMGGPIYGENSNRMEEHHSNTETMDNKIHEPRDWAGKSMLGSKKLNDLWREMSMIHNGKEKTSSRGESLLLLLLLLFKMNTTLTRL